MPVEQQGRAAFSSWHGAAGKGADLIGQRGLRRSNRAPIFGRLPGGPLVAHRQDRSEGGDGDGTGPIPKQISRDGSALQGLYRILPD